METLVTSFVLGMGVLSTLMVFAFGIWLVLGGVEKIKDLSASRRCALCSAPAVQRVWRSVHEILDTFSVLEGRCHQHRQGLKPVTRDDLLVDLFFVATPFLIIFVILVLVVVAVILPHLFL